MRILTGFIAVLICIGALTGCGTLVRGTTERYKVVSDPAGARAVFSSGEECVTPCEVEKKRNEPFSVKIMKEGFLPYAVDVKEQDCQAAEATMLANFLMVGSVIWASIDSLNGANKELTPNPCLINLVPDDPPS